MARKKLLTESEIRRFMKLANMGVVGDAKIQEYGGMNYARDDDAGEEEVGGALGVGVEEEPLEGELEGGLEPEVGLGDEVPGEGVPPLDPEQAAEVEDAVRAMVDVLEDKLGPLGIQISVDDEGAPEEEVPEVGLEPEVGLGEVPPAPEEMGMGGPEEEVPLEEPLEESEEEEKEVMDTDALVNEVARRVARRLSAQNRKDKMVNDLTEKIFHKLTQK